MRITIAASLAVAAVAAATPARADVAGWQVVPMVGTDVPVDVDAGVVVEAPFRLRLATTVGVMPPPYSTTIVDVLEGFGTLTTAEGNVIEASLDSSFVWRTMAGYRPFARHGLYAMAGYALIAFGGGATPSSAIDAATGKMLPASERGEPRALSLASTLHTLDVEVGWTWQLPDRVIVQAAVGGVFTIAARTTITPDFTPHDPAAVQQYTAAAATYLDGLYTSYVFSPTVIVGVGYRL